MHADRVLEMSDADRICVALELPSIQSFRLICGRLAKADEDERTRIIKTAEAMVATKKSPSKAELEAIDYMKKRLMGEGLLK